MRVRKSGGKVVIYGGREGRWGCRLLRWGVEGARGGAGAGVDKSG